eukprot:3228041-Rhodomonas_salina.3
MPSLKAVLLPKRQNAAVDRVVSLDSRTSWLIGSQKNSCDIFIDSDIVSESHAELLKETEVAPSQRPPHCLCNFQSWHQILFCAFYVRCPMPTEIVPLPERRGGMVPGL